MSILNNPPEGLTDFLDTKSLSENIAERASRRELTKMIADLYDKIKEKESTLPDPSSDSMNAFKATLPKCEDLKKKLSKKLKDEKPILDEFKKELDNSFESLNRLNNERIAKKEKQHLKTLNTASADAAKIVEVSEALLM